MAGRSEKITAVFNTQFINLTQKYDGLGDSLYFGYVSRNTNALITTGDSIYQAHK